MYSLIWVFAGHTDPIVGWRTYRCIMTCLEQINYVNIWDMVLDWLQSFLHFFLSLYITSCSCISQSLETDYRSFQMSNWITLPSEKYTSRVVQLSLSIFITYPGTSKWSKSTCPTKIYLIEFFFLDENICSWYLLETPRWGASNEYPQHMFSSRNRTKYVPHTLGTLLIELRSPCHRTSKLKFLPCPQRHGHAISTVLHTSIIIFLIVWSRFITSVYISNC